MACLIFPFGCKRKLTHPHICDMCQKSWHAFYACAAWLKKTIIWQRGSFMNANRLLRNIYYVGEFRQRFVCNYDLAVQILEASMRGEKPHKTVDQVFIKIPSFHSSLLHPMPKTTEVCKWCSKISQLPNAWTCLQPLTSGSRCLSSSRKPWEGPRQPPLGLGVIPFFNAEQDGPSHPRPFLHSLLHGEDDLCSSEAWFSRFLSIPKARYIYIYI